MTVAYYPSQAGAAATPAAHETTHLVGGSDALPVGDGTTPGLLKLGAAGGAQGYASILAALAALANSAGGLTNDGAGVLSYVAALASSTLTGRFRTLSTSLTTGTTQPLSLTDAVFTGETAGGATNGAGTAGIVAKSFASSGAETGTGAAQGGLGSAAASGQPYNSSDFPGQTGIKVALRKADGDAILVVNILSTAVTDLNQEVYGFLSYRSDLGANLKWRLWFYYDRSADGVPTPITPNTSLTNCQLLVPKVLTFASLSVADGFGAPQFGSFAAEIGPGVITDAMLAANVPAKLAGTTPSANGLSLISAANYAAMLALLGVTAQVAPVGLTSGDYRPSSCDLVASAGTGYVPVSGTPTCVLERQETSAVYDAVCVNQSGAGSAGKKFRICVYAQGANGLPGVLLWSSADQAADGANGEKVIAFTGGTWTSTGSASWKTGNNFSPAFGAQWYMDIETDSASGFAVTGVSVSNARVIVRVPGSFTTGMVKVTLANAWVASTPTDPAGAGTPNATGAVPLILLRLA